MEVRRKRRNSDTATSTTDATPTTKVRLVPSEQQSLLQSELLATQTALSHCKEELRQKDYLIARYEDQAGTLEHDSAVNPDDAAAHSSMVTLSDEQAPQRQCMPYEARTEEYGRLAYNKLLASHLGIKKTLESLLSLNGRLQNERRAHIDQIELLEAQLMERAPKPSVSRAVQTTRRFKDSCSSPMQGAVSANSRIPTLHKEIEALRKDRDRVQQDLLASKSAYQVILAFRHGYCLTLSQTLKGSMVVQGRERNKSFLQFLGNLHQIQIRAEESAPSVADDGVDAVVVDVAMDVDEKTVSADEEQAYTVRPDIVSQQCVQMADILREIREHGVQSVSAKVENLGGPNSKELAMTLLGAAEVLGEREQTMAMILTHQRIESTYDVKDMEWPDSKTATQDVTTYAAYESLKSVREDICELEKQRESLKNALAGASTLEEQIQDLQDQVASLKRTKQLLNNNIADQNTTIARANESLENLRDDLVELGKRKDLLEEAAVSVKTFESEIRDLQGQKTSLEWTKTLLDNDVTERNASVAKADKLLMRQRDVIHKLEERKQSLKKAEEDANMIQRQIHGCHEGKVSIEHSRELLNTKMAERKASLPEASESLQRMRADLSKLEERKEASEKEAVRANALEGEIRGLQAEKAALEQTKKTLDGDVAGASELLQRMRANLSKLEERKEASEKEAARANALEGEIRGLQAEKAALEQTKKTLDDDVAGASESLQRMRADLSKLEERKEASEKEAARVKALEGEIQNLENQKVVLEQAQVLLNGDLAERHVSVAEADELLKRLRAAILTLEERKEPLEKNVEHRAKVLEGEIRGLQDEKVALKQSKKALDDDVAEASESLKCMRVDLFTLEERKKSLEKATAVAQNVKVLETEIQGLQDQKAALECAIALLQRLRDEQRALEETKESNQKAEARALLPDAVPKRKVPLSGQRHQMLATNPNLTGMDRLQLQADVQDLMERKAYFEGMIQSANSVSLTEHHRVCIDCAETLRRSGWRNDVILMSTRAPREDDRQIPRFLKQEATEWTDLPPPKADTRGLLPAIQDTKATRHGNSRLKQSKASSRSTVSLETTNKRHGMSSHLPATSRTPVEQSTSTTRDETTMRRRTTSLDTRPKQRNVDLAVRDNTRHGQSRPSGSLSEALARHTALRNADIYGQLKAATTRKYPNSGPRYWRETEANISCAQNAMTVGPKLCEVEDVWPRPSCRGAYNMGPHLRPQEASGALQASRHFSHSIMSRRFKFVNQTPPTDIVPATSQDHHAIEYDSNQKRSKAEHRKRIKEIKGLTEELTRAHENAGRDAERIAELERQVSDLRHRVSLAEPLEVSRQPSAPHFGQALPASDSNLSLVQESMSSSAPKLLRNNEYRELDFRLCSTSGMALSALEPSGADEPTPDSPTPTPEARSPASASQNLETRELIDLSSGATNLWASPEIDWACGVKTRYPRLTNVSFDFDEAQVEAMSRYPNARDCPDMVVFVPYDPEDPSPAVRATIEAQANGKMVVVEGAGKICKASDDVQDPAMNLRYLSCEAGRGVVGAALDIELQAHDMEARMNLSPLPEADPDPDDALYDDKVIEGTAAEDEIAGREVPEPFEPYVNRTIRQFVENVNSDKHIQAILDIPGGFPDEDVINKRALIPISYLSSGHLETSTISLALGNADYQFRPADLAATASWYLLHQAGFLTHGHIDASGLGTTFEIRGPGAKLWLVLEFDGGRKLRGCVIVVREGDRIVQPPGKGHIVYTPLPSVTAGKHFVNWGSLHHGEVGRAFEMLTNRCATNHDHAYMQLMLIFMAASLPARVKEGREFYKKPLIAMCLMVLWPRRYIHHGSIQDRVGKLNDDAAQQFLVRLRDPDGDWVRGNVDRLAQLVCLAVMEELVPNRFLEELSSSKAGLPKLPDITPIREWYLFLDTKDHSEWQAPGPKVNLGYCLAPYIGWTPPEDDPVLLLHSKNKGKRSQNRRKSTQSASKNARSKNARSKNRSLATNDGNGPAISVPPSVAHPRRTRSTGLPSIDASHTSSDPGRTTRSRTSAAAQGGRTEVDARDIVPAAEGEKPKKSSRSSVRSKRKREYGNPEAGPSDRTRSGREAEGVESRPTKRSKGKKAYSNLTEALNGLRP
ncbi:hypothetical protein EV715DRAFT_268423 [Schizophyllum commune]